MKKLLVALIAVVGTGCAPTSVIFSEASKATADFAEYSDIDWEGDLDTSAYKGPCAPWAVNVAVNQLENNSGNVVSQEDFDNAAIEMKTKDVGTKAVRLLKYFLDRDYKVSKPKKLESCDQYASMAGAMEQGCSVVLTMTGSNSGHVETVKSIDAGSCSGVVNSLEKNFDFDGVSGDFLLDGFNNYDGEDSVVSIITVCEGR